MSVPTDLARSAGRGAAWSGLGSIALRLGGLTVGIVLARLLTPDQFGVYAVALTVQSILLATSDLGLAADVIRSDKPDEIAPTVATLGLANGVLLTVIMFFSSGSLASLMGSPEAATAIALLSLTLTLSGASVIPFAMLQRRFQQRELFVVGMADFVVSTTTTLLMVWLGYGVLALAVGRVAAQLVSSALQFYFAKTRPSFGIDRSRLRPILAFGLPVAGANMLSWVALNVDNIILARMTNVTSLGFYVLAFNIASWPMTALGQVVRSISLPYFARMKDSADHLTSVVALAWAGALPAGALLAVMSTPLIHTLYGSKWLPSAPVLATLGIYGSLRVLFDLFAGYLYAKGRSTAVLHIQILSTVTLIASMVFATGRYGVIGAGWAHVAVAVAVVLPSYTFVLRRMGLNVRHLVRAAAWPTMLAIPPIGAALLATTLLTDALARLVVGSALGGVIYVALIWPWLRRTWVELRAEPSPAEVV